jgi:hypothetical protein
LLPLCLTLAPVVQGVGDAFDLFAAFPHLEDCLERLVDLLVNLAQVGFVRLQDEGIERRLVWRFELWCGFELWHGFGFWRGLELGHGFELWRCFELRRGFTSGADGVEFESKAKAGATANDAGHADLAHGLELDLHDVAGLEIDAAV